MRWLLLLLTLTACGRGLPTQPLEVTLTPAAAPEADCASQVTSTHPHVRLTLPPQRCAFSVAEAAQGIAFRYQVQVDADATLAVTGSAPSPLTSCPQLQGGVYVFERIEGHGQGYCLCDSGRCASAPPAMNPAPGVTEVSYPWDGVNWSGPSDFGNPKGPAFPPGDYTFTARASGSAGNPGTPWEATATLFFRLTP